VKQAYLFVVVSTILRELLTMRHVFSSIISVLIISSHASATPPAHLTPQITTGSTTPGSFIDVLENTSVPIDDTVVIQSTEPDFVSAVRFSYSSTTHGYIRTLTQIWESVEDSLFSEDAFSYLYPNADPNDRSSISWVSSANVFPMDPDWDESPIIMRSILSGDGVTIRDMNHTVSFFSTITSINAPGNPGDSDWLGSNVRLDRIERTYAYRVVPSPASVSLLILAATGFAPRKRRTS